MNSFSFAAFFILLSPIFAFFVVPIRPQYDEEFARKMLNLAAGAYGSSPQGCINRTFTSDQGYREYNAANLICDSLDDTCAFYAVVSDVERNVVVVFRGTNTNLQLLVEGFEADEQITFFQIGTVSAYFGHVLEKMWPNVVTVLRDPNLMGYTVSFTGHSLGAALASIASIRCVLEGYRTPPQIKLVTFGQPRTGNVEFAAHHDLLVPYSFRLVHRHDIVPHLAACKKLRHVRNANGSRPCDPTNLKKPYHHGVEVWYPEGMGPGAKYFVCLGLPKNEDFGCSDSLVFKVEDYAAYVDDHRHYFDYKVPPYGELGCSPNKTIEEQMDNGL
ncbi:hypothetical protein L596_018186 [Steinernema carpocapsae]|uniref:Fungal lipase-type domain-containing protein n=1 Tax=Steinernema carpocapsae TaxID=34508 RepID=A0A4U5N3W7_STECR|nr:hypothetical protein L596_018186 [Steinernema carpocapsae]